MRKILAIFPFALLALSACGQKEEASVTPPPVAEQPPAQPAGPPLPPWRVALTDHPTQVKAYSTALGALTGAKVESAGSGTRITTGAGNSAWAGMSILGKEAKVPGGVLHLNVQVEKGALLFVSTIDRAPKDHVAHQELVTAGQATDVWLPVDTGGDPLLIVADGTEKGASVGVLNSIELLAPPSSAPPAAPAPAPAPASKPQ